MKDGLYYYTHTNVLFHIVMHTQLAEMGQGPPKLSLIFRHLLHNYLGPNSLYGMSSSSVDSCRHLLSLSLSFLPTTIVGIVSMPQRTVTALRFPVLHRL